MSRPLVSLCVPTYNRAGALRESLKSIQGQDYPHLEILISDNGSTDETEAVARATAQGDPRIRYVRHPRNIGLYGNHNFCIKESQGELLGFCHDHDERDLRIVSEYVAFLDAHPDAGVVCSDWDLIDEAGAHIGVRAHNVPQVTPGLAYIDRTIRTGRSSIGAPGALFRRAALGEARFDEQGPIGFGDFLVWFRIAERASVGHIPRRLWRWRQQPQSQSARTIESMVQDYAENLSRYCDGHLRRWPNHAALVERWRMCIRRYLFWALAFEVGLYFRERRDESEHRLEGRTLFEILNYRLSRETFERTLHRLREYRTGPPEHAAFLTIRALVQLRLTRPLAWATYHRSSLTGLLGLK